MSTPNPNVVYCFVYEHENGLPSFFPHKEDAPEEIQNQLHELYRAPPCTAVRIPVELDVRKHRKPWFTPEYAAGWNACREALIDGMKEDAARKKDPEAGPPQDKVSLNFATDPKNGQTQVLLNGKQHGWIRHNKQAALPYSLEIFGFGFTRRDGRWVCVSHGDRSKLLFLTENEAKDATLRAIRDIIAEQVAKFRSKEG